MATVLRAGRSGFRISVAARIFALENIHTTVGGPSSLLFNGYRVKRPEREADHHLVPKLRMSGAISLLPLYALRAWTRKKFLT